MRRGYKIIRDLCCNSILMKQTYTSITLPFIIYPCSILVFLWSRKQLTRPWTWACFTELSSSSVFSVLTAVLSQDCTGLDCSVSLFNSHTLYENIINIMNFNSGAMYAAVTTEHNAKWVRLADTSQINWCTWITDDLLKIRNMQACETITF